MTTGYEFKASAKLLNALAQVPKLMRQPLGESVIRVVQPQIEAAFNEAVDTHIRPYPAQRPAGQPRVWSNNPVKNALGRKWYWANIGQAPYERSGDLAKAWQAKVSMSVARMSLQLENPAKGASYVFGSKPHDFVQVPMHAATGHLNMNVQGVKVVADVRQVALKIIQAEQRKQITQAMKGQV